VPALVHPNTTQKAHARVVPFGRQILEVAGFKFARQNRLDLAPCANLPITLVFLPAADIPKYVAEGNIDMGITGNGTRLAAAARTAGHRPIGC